MRIFVTSKFKSKAVDMAVTRWTVCTYGDRIYRRKENGVWKSSVVHLTEELKRIFRNAGVDYTGDLKEAVSSISKRDFFVDLLELFSLTVQMRNYSVMDGAEYIISPVADKDGRFFCSEDGDATLPLKGDANAAYNIARKGLMNIHAIMDCPAGERPNLGITNKDWFTFIQS